MKNRLVELEIVDLANNGRAVGYDGGKVTFVDGGLPGERVEAVIVRSKRTFNQAHLLRLLTRSPDRIPAACEHFAVCGGCSWQDLDYGRQLDYKRNQVVAALERIGGFEDVAVGEIHPSPDKFFYRNKMEFSFHVHPFDRGRSPGGFVLGLHERGRFDSIFDLHRCHLQSETSNQIVAFLREKVSDLGLPVYDLVAHAGFLRFAIVREGKNTGQTMVVLVTGAGSFDDRERLTAALCESLPSVTTVIWMINDTITNIARGEVREVLFGPGYIEEEILGLRFRIGPLSFFQTNSRQAEALYRTAIDLAGLTGSETVLDLYCGAGAIGLCAAARAGRVIGIDIEAESIAAADINAAINGITSCRFLAGNAHEVLASADLRDVAFDVVFNDPPRAGMHPKALERLIDLQARRLIYVSCNPATFARDAAGLSRAGYRLCEVIPFDMFPHTMHTELAARFEKNG